MEIWKTVPNYNDYQVSNLGNVKSLKFGKERILKPVINGGKYLSVNFRFKSKQKIFKIHQLVAMAFLNHNPCGYKLVVNHINFNNLDNRLENLEIITQRENTNRKHKKHSSIYTGVCWHKKNKHWYSRIIINTKKIYLGSYQTEYDAHLAYENKLKEISQT